MADYAYTFKAPPAPPQHQDQYEYHSHAPSASSYILPLPSSSSTASHSSFTNSNLATPNSGSNTSTSNPIAPPTALLWTDLKSWMDADYARQVCALMRWEAGILVPSPPPPSSSSTYGGGGTGVNNAGYELLSFASADAAARALAQQGHLSAGAAAGQLTAGSGSGWSWGSNSNYRSIVQHGQNNGGEGSMPRAGGAPE
ncbi:hypothetical protein DFH08DRAFT_984143 [Mycena albidolilacea]|uniref:Uncharacterized protein n=1 Tax=Mycena albidolilacea TaxID=1033008 RepID=A0AAD7AW67_9AGAR|nr:hypothetical protein DFH08DRAFT_984143 [Mycena albidolilacea]